MGYEHVFVANVCLGNMTQLVTALREADEYDGPSFVGNAGKPHSDVPFSS